MHRLALHQIIHRKPDSGDTCAPKCRLSELRDLWPYAAFALLNLVGIVLFYALETLVPPQLDSRTTERAMCMGARGFAGYLFFTLSATTTIGFGAIYPCNIYSRVFGIFYCLLGIPLTLIMISKVGKTVSNGVHALHRALPPRPKKSTTKKQLKTPAEGPATASEVEPLAKGAPEMKEAAAADEEAQVPISLGVGFILVAIFLAALYYVGVEGYGKGESIYWSFYTFIAGDLQMNNLKYALPMFALVILGFAMVATTYEIIQANIDRMSKKVQRQLEVHHQKILNGELDMSEADEILGQYLKQNSSPLMRLVMTSRQTKTLQDVSDALMGKTIISLGGNAVGTQVELDENQTMKRAKKAELLASPIAREAILLKAEAAIQSIFRKTSGSQTVFLRPPPAPALASTESQASLPIPAKRASVECQHVPLSQANSSQTSPTCEVMDRETWCSLRNLLSPGVDAATMQKPKVSTVSCNTKRAKISAIASNTEGLPLPKFAVHHTQTRPTPTTSHGTATVLPRRFNISSQAAKAYSTVGVRCDLDPHRIGLDNPVFKLVRPESFGLRLDLPKPKETVGVYARDAHRRASVFFREMDKRSTSPQPPGRPTSDNQPERRESDARPSGQDER